MTDFMTEQESKTLLADLSLFGTPTCKVSKWYENWYPIEDKNSYHNHWEVWVESIPPQQFAYRCIDNEEAYYELVEPVTKEQLEELGFYKDD
jgi:hypothetical protein